jgi:hypothetical protein
MSDPILTWRDISGQLTRRLLYAGTLYAARIVSLRPGHWAYALASGLPEPVMTTIGDFATADLARDAAQYDVRQRLNHQ